MVDRNGGLCRADWTSMQGWMTRMAKRSLRIRSRFALVLVVLVPAVLAVAGVGVQGLRSGRDAANVLYRDNLLTSQTVTSLDVALADAHQVSLKLLLADTPADRQRLITQLVTQIAPHVQDALSAVTAQSADEPDEWPSVRTVAAGWARFQQLLATGALAGASPASRAAVAKQAIASLDAATGAAKSISRIEGIQGEQAHRAALRDYHSSLELMLLAGILGLLFTVAVVVWLIRSVLPRTLAYSTFATEVGQGDYSRRLHPDGHDELAQLGRVLDDLAQRRQGEDTHDRNHRELIDTLQLAESEQEAHDLLKRHLQRTVTGSQITVLNRNNSADRLQAVTPVEPDSALAVGLQSAKPRSCLAIRKAQSHCTTSGQDSLLACPVCSGSPGLTTCTPLVVGGEVIGSVLANHANPLEDTEQRSVREAVTQAAPVIGNQRNLAIAEQRASTDSLTGLPNKQAIHDALRRIVAQSSRTKTQLAALMCDLDHFKQINDRYGHSCGDDLLAAVGAVLADTIRGSDFAGRYGGEEFLVLLSDTNADGAVVTAEKLRAAIAAIQIPTVNQTITLSVGIAVLPDHAIDSDSLQRAADRALYAAKNAGRDRIEISTSQQLRAEPGPPSQHPPTPLRRPQPDAQDNVQRTM
jgi:diguanylate cyclase (GGDEF)-like protein